MASPLFLTLVSIEHMQKKRLMDLAGIFRIRIGLPLMHQVFYIRGLQRLVQIMDSFQFPLKKL
jgi:hypothetical protein